MFWARVSSETRLERSTEHPSTTLPQNRETQARRESVANSHQFTQTGNLDWGSKILQLPRNWASHVSPTQARHAEVAETPTATAGVRLLLKRARSTSTMGSEDEQYDFDLVTIGAGSGGTRASRCAAVAYYAAIQLNDRYLNAEFRILVRRIFPAAASTCP